MRSWPTPSTTPDPPGTSGTRSRSSAVGARRSSTDGGARSEERAKGKRDDMRVMAQMSMVMNLDKCIGCHTCSVTCKQAWTNRTGTEYVWFNNVETRPGLGYPRTYEDQEVWQGGWTLNRRGKLKIKAGGRAKRIATIFSNTKMKQMQVYSAPWDIEYDMMLHATCDQR